MKQLKALLLTGAALGFYAFPAASQELTAINDRVENLASNLSKPVATQAEPSAIPVASVGNATPLDRAYHYAESASQQGKYGVAAETYQRMLMVNPSLDRVRLDLGLAYAKLGQYDQARGEFNTVMQHDVPDRVKRNIESVLRQIDAKSRRNDFTGSVAAGTLFDSNGNSAPGTGNVLVRDTLYNLDKHDQPVKDIQGFATASLGHTYHAQTLPLDWRSSGTYYQTDQNKLHQLDLDIISGTTGPSYRISPGTSLDFTGGYTSVSLDGHIYLRLPSAEVGLEQDLGSTWHGRFSLREEYRQFVNAPGVTVYSQRSGLAHQMRYGILHVLSEHDLIDASLTLRREEAKENYFADWQVAPQIGYTHSWGEGYFARAEASWRNSVYDDPDRVISQRKRHDDEKAIGLTLGKNFANNVSLSAAYEYRNVDSSIINYDYDNHRVTLTAGWHF